MKLEIGISFHLSQMSFWAHLVLEYNSLKDIRTVNLALLGPYAVPNPWKQTEPLFLLQRAFLF